VCIGSFFFFYFYMVNKTKLFSISALLWLRWLTASLPGYIHPDEFFQNAEITAAQVFGLHVFTPWEYQEAAARSIVSP
jgi:phosphatidylinositol glycan class Z